MLNVPNAITLVRLASIPIMAYFIVVENYCAALPVFLVAALSDFADGYIARRFNLTS